MGMSKNEKKKHFFYVKAVDDEEARNPNYEGLFANLIIVTAVPDYYYIICCEIGKRSPTRSFEQKKKHKTVQTSTNSIRDF